MVTPIHSYVILNTWDPEQRGFTQKPMLKNDALWSPEVFKITLVAAQQTECPTHGLTGYPVMSHHETIDNVLHRVYYMMGEQYPTGCFDGKFDQLAQFDLTKGPKGEMRYTRDVRMTNEQPVMFSYHECVKLETWGMVRGFAWGVLLTSAANFLFSLWG